MKGVNGLAFVRRVGPYVNWDVISSYYYGQCRVLQVSYGVVIKGSAPYVIPMINVYYTFRVGVATGYQDSHRGEYVHLHRQEGVSRVFFFFG